MKIPAPALALFALLVLSSPAFAETVLLKNGEKIGGDIFISYQKGLLVRKGEGAPGRYYPFDEVNRVSTEDGRLYYLMPRSSKKADNSLSLFPLSRMILAGPMRSEPIPCIIPPRGDSITVACTGAGDAATLEIEGGGKVRLLGIAPPPPSAGPRTAERARRRLSALVKGKNALLFPGPQSHGGADLPEAYAMIGRKFINAELIQNGWALASPIPESHPYREAFTSLQKFAKSMGRGIWKNTPQ